MQNVELIQKIYEWADARNLIKGSTPVDQGMKLLSEFGELADRGIGRNNQVETIDGIGDVAVVMTVIAGQVGAIELLKSKVEKLPFSYAPIEDTTVDTSTKQKIIVLGQPILEVIRMADMVKLGIAPIEEFIKPLGVAFSILNLITTEEGLTFNQCLQHAYDEIKDRKGVMHNGIFVKSTDESYEDAVKAVALAKGDVDGQS